MVGGLFPTPYPDECLYSIFCRYCVRIGCTSLKSVRNLLFGGQQCLASSIFFPIRLNLIDKWYGEDSGVTRKLIAEKHTMHPYMTIVYPDKFRRQVDSVIRGGCLPKAFDIKGTQRSHRLWPKYLRYCPDCVREDVDAYGETYWHRIHQLPAMVFCTKHQVRLCDSEALVIGSLMGFCPASIEPLSVPRITEEDSITTCKEQFIRIGLESEWLLQHGADIDWEFGLHAKYKRHLRDKGVATVQGVSDYTLIANAFETYWGSDFLDCLRLELSDSREWIRQICEARMASFKPIYHILLMCFLSGSVEAFLNNAPQESIFGNSPWACMNTLCDHFGVDGVEILNIRYCNGKATGYFRCGACGMVYKQLYWRKQLSPLHIVEYGDIWIDRMIRCLQDEKLSIPATAKVMKCEPHIVRFQMKKLGILGDPVYTRKVRTYNDMGAAAFYRAQVSVLCEKYVEVTSDILDQYAHNAYKYLYKFDLDWLHKHMTLQVHSKRQHDEDVEMLQQVQKAVALICSDGKPERQITLGFVAVTAGYEIQALDYLAAKRPLTKAYIETVVESRIDWLRRRITAIAQNIRVAGGKISISDIKREMSLKPSTYVKYGNFLKELIAELNE